MPNSRLLDRPVEDSGNQALLRRRDPGRFAAREQPPLVGSPFRPALFRRSSACVYRALQTLRQPPRQWGHAQILTGGADAVRAQHFFQEVLAVTRHSRQHLDSPLTAGGGADHWSSVGTGARWRHRSAIQDALGGTLRTFLGAGKGLPPLPLQHLALLSQIPNQHRQTNRLCRRMRIGAAQDEPSRNNGERFVAPGYACVPRVDSFSRYHDTVLPKGAHVWYKGNDGLWWLGKSTRALPRTRYTWSAFWTTRD